MFSKVVVQTARAAAHSGPVSDGWAVGVRECVKLGRYSCETILFAQVRLVLLTFFWLLRTRSQETNILPAKIYYPLPTSTLTGIKRRPRLYQITA